MTALVLRKNGFSVAELLITISVAAVLVATATPSLIALWQRANVQRTSHAMSTSLALARIHAVTKGQPATLCPSLDGRTCIGGADWSSGWILYRDPRRSSQPESPQDVIEVTPSLHASVSIRSTMGRQRIRFHPSGFSPGSNLRFALCSGRPERLMGSIVLSNAGRARVERHDSGEPCPRP